MGEKEKEGGGESKEYSLLKILIQSTSVTGDRKGSPADAGSALIKGFLMAVTRLPIVMSFPPFGRTQGRVVVRLIKNLLFTTSRRRADREDCRL